MAYCPIEEYGLIGNMRTAALVSKNGSVDWLCLPAFDSPSVFGAILDDRIGGRFDIRPQTEHLRTKQFYRPDTNVLITRFLSADGIGEIEDLMPVGIADDSPWCRHLVRRVTATRGRLIFRLRCQPACDYARQRHEVRLSSMGARFTSQSLAVDLASHIPLMQDETGVHATFALTEGQDAVFAFGQAPSDVGLPRALSSVEAQRLIRQTVDYWHRWLSKSTYGGRWREMVNRSALTLKLMTYEPTGAIVAAPTCSLPETLGGERNWDYRYTWLRDAAFTLYGLLRLGFTEEAHHFMEWLGERMAEVEQDGDLQSVYGIDGRHELTEQHLDHLEGYRGSRPVRIGNAAYRQLQLDIYGELFDSLYLYNKYVMPIGYDAWLRIRRQLDWLSEHWREPDEGIWEVRGGRQQFVHTKLMSWVAMDRGVRLAEKRSFPADIERWRRIRDQIYEEIMANGWSHTRQAFVRQYGSDRLDAAVLLMPLVFFMAPNDPRMLRTLDAIRRSPEQGGLVSDGLVYRYDNALGTDGVDGKEGTFSMCSFWLVEALTRAGRFEPGKLAEARLLFERVLGHANHLGLYGEQIGDSGETLGNFPQAFTHIALISAASNLDRALNDTRVA